MHPLGASLTFFFAVFVAFGAPRFAIVALFGAVGYLTQGQEITIGFHFTAVRILLFVGLARVILRGEMRAIRTNSIDRALITYAIFSAILPFFREGTTDSLVYNFGVFYNTLLSYIVFRSLLSNSDTPPSYLALTAVTIIPLSILLSREANTGTNIFSGFGGVPEISMFRDGHVRSQGSFRSPITAGAFGATLAMLFIGRIFSGDRRLIFFIGVGASCIIVLCARSSGPLLGLGIGLVALACWPLRSHTRKLRWCIALTLFALNLVMKVPVWFLIGRISDIVGGGGYHRAYLIDQFFRSWSSWWIWGTSDTSSWMPTELEFGGADLTNQFVSDGVNAGLIGLVLSLALIVQCYRRLGTAMDVGTIASAKSLWSLGSTLSCSLGILFSVTYFDQMHVLWYFVLACISTATDVPPHPVESAENDSDTSLRLE